MTEVKLTKVYYSLRSPFSLPSLSFRLVDIFLLVHLLSFFAPFLANFTCGRLSTTHVNPPKDVIDSNREKVLIKKPPK